MADWGRLKRIHGGLKISGIYPWEIRDIRDVPLGMGRQVHIHEEFGKKWYESRVDGGRLGRIHGGLGKTGAYPWGIGEDWGVSMGV